MCTKQSPSTWEHARVDTMRDMVHCKKHTKRFHKNDQGDKWDEACITCDVYNPERFPINRVLYKDALLPTDFVPEQKPKISQDTFFDFSEVDGLTEVKEVNRFVTLHEKAKDTVARTLKELAVLQKRHFDTEKSIDQAELKLLSAKKELVLARIELQQSGVEIDRKSLLGKRLRSEESWTEPDVNQE